MPAVRQTIFRNFTYGLYIASAQFEAEIAIKTVTWVTQASMEPPVIAVGLRNDSMLERLVDRSGRVVLMLLDEAQQDIAASFFKPVAVQGMQANGWEFVQSAHNKSPVLTVVPAWIEARVINRVEAGDHTMYLAEAEHLHLNAEIETFEPLRLSETPWHYGK